MAAKIEELAMGSHARRAKKIPMKYQDAMKDLTVDQHVKGSK